MLEVLGRMEYSHPFTSIRNVHSLIGKRVSFSNSYFDDIAIFEIKDNGTLKFTVKNNYASAKSRAIDRMEKDLVKQAEKLNSVQMIVDLSEHKPENAVVYDITNNKEIRYFSAYYSKNLIKDILIKYKVEKDGILGEEKLGVLAVDHDCLPAWATFQNIACMFNVGEFEIKEYGASTGFKLFSALRGYKINVPSHVKAEEFFELGTKIVGTVLDESRKQTLLGLFSGDENEELVNEPVIIEDEKYSLIELISKGEIPNEDESIYVNVDLDIGLKIKEAYTRNGWLHFVMENEDDKFFDDYSKNRDELIETLGGIDKVSVMKYNPETADWSGYDSQGYGF